MTSSLEFYLPQVNASKVCITSVCVFISSWCMAWMLSIKYFVFFAEILRFSLNWRTHLQNDVIFGILFAPQVNASKVCITSVCVFISSWCMAWMLSIKYFVFFAEILRFSLNWRTHLQNDVIFGILFASGQCPKVCITSVCVFISSLSMAWMLSIKYFVFFAEILRFSLNWRTHLQNDVIFGILFASGQCL